MIRFQPTKLCGRSVWLSTLFLLTLPLAAVEKATPWLSPSKLEDITLFIINQERSARNLPPFKSHPILKKIARKHSAKMVAENTLSHEFPDYPPLEKRLINNGLTFSAFAENVAKGDTITLRLIHEALMRSPGHRVNLLNSETSDIGIGIIIGDNNLYMTQVFARLNYPSSATAMEEKLTWEIQKRNGTRQRPSIVTTQEIKTRAKRFLDKIFSNQNPADLYMPQSPYSFLVLTFEKIDETLISSCVMYLLKARARIWDVSIRFGRTSQCPGGTYAMILCCQR